MCQHRPQQQVRLRGPSCVYAPLGREDAFRVSHLLQCAHLFSAPQDHRQRQLCPATDILRCRSAACGVVVRLLQVYLGGMCSPCALPFQQASAITSPHYYVFALCESLTAELNAKLGQLLQGQKKLEAGQKKLEAGQDELKKELALVRYTASHAMTPEAMARVEGGAVFYIIDPISKKSLVCGFFVDPRVALSVSHDPIFRSPMPITLSAIDSTGASLELDLLSTDLELDYSILRVKGEPRASFFMLPSAGDVVKGNLLALVSMGIGRAAAMNQAASGST